MNLYLKNYRDMSMFLKFYALITLFGTIAAFLILMYTPGLWTLIQFAVSAFTLYVLNERSLRFFKILVFFLTLQVFLSAISTIKAFMVQEPDIRIYIGMFFLYGLYAILIYGLWRQQKYFNKP